MPRSKPAPLRVAPYLLPDRQPHPLARLVFEKGLTHEQVSDYLREHTGVTLEPRSIRNVISNWIRPMHHVALALCLGVCDESDPDRRAKADAFFPQGKPEPPRRPKRRGIRVA